MDAQKGIRDSVKYGNADTTVGYMTFLEECRKAEDEDGVGKQPLLLLLTLQLIMMSLLNSLENNSNSLNP